MIDTKLLESIACPICKGDVEYDARNEKLTCVECGKRYAVIDGIPIMRADAVETV